MGPAERLAAIFRAGRTRRWHADAWLADTVDPVDGHAARVARIVLALHPPPGPSAQLLAACLIHDDGENGETGIGDIPGPVKMRLNRSAPMLGRELAMLEEFGLQQLWGDTAIASEPIGRDVSRDDLAWLQFADRLDRVIWGGWHRPSILQRPSWEKLCERLEIDAAELGIDMYVRDLLDALAP